MLKRLLKSTLETVVIFALALGLGGQAKWDPNNKGPAINLLNGNDTAVLGNTYTCSTLPGLNCDANGWTIFSVGPSGYVEGRTACGALSGGTALQTTCIFYVSSSTGSDANDGSFGNPYATPGFVTHNIMRNGAPDWVSCLWRCLARSC